MKTVYSIVSTTLLVLVPLSPAVRADAPENAVPNAQQIFARVAKVYAGCKTYADTGVVRNTLSSKDDVHTNELAFKTAFVRPDHFRFEYTQKHGSENELYIVWRNGKLVQSWWSLQPHVVTEESLDLALGGATGVSEGTAATIPAELLPKEVGLLRLTAMPGAKRIEDARLDGADCFCIVAKDVPSLPSVKSDVITVWIDKRSFLIRRVYETYQTNTFSSQKTTTYSPTVNGKIADKMLQFNTPKQAK